MAWNSETFQKGFEIIEKNEYSMMGSFRLKNINKQDIRQKATQRENLNDTFPLKST